MESSLFLLRGSGIRLCGDAVVDYSASLTVNRAMFVEF
jgi:hypothetical protein